MDTIQSDTILRAMSICQEAQARHAAAEREPVQDFQALVEPALSKADSIVHEVETLLDEERLALFRSFQVALAHLPPTAGRTVETLNAKLSEVIGIRTGIHAQVAKIRGDVATTKPEYTHLSSLTQEVETRCRAIWSAPAAVKRLCEEIDGLAQRLAAGGVPGLVLLPSVVEPAPAPTAAPAIETDFDPFNPSGR